MVINLFVSAQTQGRKFFVTGVSQRIRSQLEIAKADGVFNSCDSIEGARALT